MWSRANAILLSTLTVAALVACLDLHDDAAQRRDNPCAACHGDGTRGGSALQASAPPFDLAGNDDVAYPGVGAHAVHLSAGETHPAFECSECHRVPSDVRDPGHMDSAPPAELHFGELARRGSAEPSYHPKTRRCSDTYCHGDRTHPWTDPRSSERACGTCHGLPPALPHPQSEECSKCHGAVVDAGLRFIDPSLHVDGTVQRNEAECNTCHGSDAGAAPPRDLQGNSEPAARGVGAHQAHLSSSLGRALDCSECHQVPDQVQSSGHLDGSGVEVMLAFGQYDPETLRCSDTRCHGTVTATPEWTDPTPLDCETCHGMPPSAPHPQLEDCSACHGEVVDSDGAVVARELHVDGQIQVRELDCSGCHGGVDGPAPPRDLLGNVETSARGVGAHRAHLSSSLGKPLSCSQCHPVPEQLSSPGHADGSGVDVRLEDGNFDAEALRCSTACHGRSAASPVWNDPTPVDCESCHGMPPSAPHPQMENCATCHPAVAAVDPTGDFGVVIANPTRHVDGTVQVTAPSGCSSCHGDLDGDASSASAAAPPRDTFGRTDTSARGVGAHAQHLFENGRSRPLSCDECHLVPERDDSPGHFDSTLPSEVTFQGVATAFGATPSYDAPTCRDTYCHGGSFIGARPSGGTDTEPDWTLVDQSQVSCASCHGMPPPSPHPQEDVDVCGQCHHNAALGGGFSRPHLHVDGVVTFFLGDE